MSPFSTTILGAAPAAATPPAAEAGGSSSGIETMISSVLEQLPGYAIKVVGVLAVFIIGRWLAKRLAAGLEGSLEKRDFDPTLSRFFGSMTRVLMLVVVALACLSIFGIETTSVVAVLAAAGFAVGMALQGSLANFAAGVMLIIFRPYRVGDIIKTAGETGGVFSIGLFTTVLDTPDNRRITVPNGAVFSGTIENLTTKETRRADIDVGCDYSADIDATRALLEASIANVPSRIEDAPHDVYLVGLGGSSVDWQVRIWCKPEDWHTCRQQTIRATKLALDAAGIGIPYPTMDVHVDGKIG